MPLAHPVSATTSPNFGSEPFLVIKMITANPGEVFTDFSHRVENPPSVQWGMRNPRESHTELILDPSSARRMAALLQEFLDR